MDVIPPETTSQKPPYHHELEMTTQLIEQMIFGRRSWQPPSNDKWLRDDDDEQIKLC